MRLGMVLAAASVLSACAAGPAPAPTAGVPPPVVTYSGVGLERVLGQDAPALARLFGTADADVSEGTGRKLQFGSDICVLDAYLYPPRAGAAAVVRHVDARQRTGAPIDRASCVAALVRREGGR